MNNVVAILMKRDGMSRAEAVALVAEVRGMIEDADGDYDEAEQIMIDELGLEMDYIRDIWWGGAYEHEKACMPNMQANL